jgi:hypothetical protein
VLILLLIVPPMRARIPLLHFLLERWTWGELRQRLVLTPEEKRVIGFILVAFLLGLGTKCYRDAHPHEPVRKHLRSGKIQR